MRLGFTFDNLRRIELQLCATVSIGVNVTTIDTIAELQRVFGEMRLGFTFDNLHKIEVQQ